MAEAKKTTKTKAKATEVAEEVLSTEVVTTDVEAVTEVKTTKAGKHSAKALKEVEAKAEKEARKAEKAEDGEDKPKAPVKPTRTRLERSSKGYRKSSELLVAGKLYTLDEAIKLAKQTSHVKFDATVELHVNLSVDPRHADQNIRDSILLPAGSGKKVRVAVLTDDPATAKKAGADIAGTDDLLAQLEKGTINFDILISTPALMAKLGKYARTLGPRGLMPNPKSGTVTVDINRAVSEAKAGRVEYRVDTTGIVHIGFGKVSFTEPQLLENVQAVLTSIKANKPNSVKNAYFKSVHISTTMGPSMAVDLASVNQ